MLLNNKNLIILIIDLIKFYLLSLIKLNKLCKNNLFEYNYQFLEEAF
jgi:hypothetical protein